MHAPGAAFAVRQGLPAVAVLLGLSLSGCAEWNLRGDGFQDGTAHWTDNLRPRMSPGQGVGVSTKAKEIEADFGY